MRLINFSVTNYKVFKKKFTINFSTDSIAILTGRNNTGKSTILEAIFCFFKNETKAKTISTDCFSKETEEIIFEAEFNIKNENYVFIKKYKKDAAPKFYDKDNIEIDKKHPLKQILEELLNNKPFYITPSMLPEDIDELIHNIYSEIIKSDLEKLESLKRTDEDQHEDHLIELAEEYKKLKQSYPEFLRKLKLNTDEILNEVSKDVSTNLQSLFSNDNLHLEVIGGETEGFSSNDLLKSTNSSVKIKNHQQEKMLLTNQGTGLQRMSLIYLIQNMIQKNLLGDRENKLLLIDEPEAFLHPEAVRALSSSLYSIGSTMPLMISTHSPILIDLSEGHTSIQVFRVGEHQAIQLYKSEKENFDKDDIKNMKILNYVDSYVNEFFFADKIIVVEGDTEYIAFKHLAKNKNINLHIIRARGKSTICTLMKILNQFKSSYDILHDVDNHSRFSTTTLKAQQTNCKKIMQQKGSRSGINVFCSISNFENAIGIGDISNDKKTQTIFEILNADPESSYAETKRLIEKLFDKIISKSASTLSPNFMEIQREKDYELLFEDLIVQKIQEETKVKATK
ncbi:AAA family ATPase [uncultured Exiguobacterium sp.]|uniref:ATP-dependent nuclease n=1 Tax=uncultured Exiguobacterium sp. TaxID=202669 RepID=UPI0025ECD920|nr:AAA family ATPase [uncultured Exiguobacterium sp.]